MSLRHTKSPSGKTHRLSHKTAHQPPIETVVTLRYRNTPQFDDRVQGDLLRKMQSEHGLAMGVGMLPVHIDHALQDGYDRPLSAEYLRGYLAGLENGRGLGMRSHADAIREVREQIARAEARENGVYISEIAHGGPVVNQGPPPAGGVAAGAASIQMNVVQNRVGEPSAAEIARRDLMRRRAERGGR